MIFDMNYPFAVYPRGVLSGYISYKHYVEEAIRLKNYIITLKNNLVENNGILKHLIIINIGSAGEELIYYYHKHPEYNYEDNEYYQWRQIHPIHIEDFVNKYKKNLKITVIIISPDEYQRDFDYDPAFTQNEIFINKSAIVYNKINNQCYEYVNNDSNIIININFFNCFMPQIENNKHKIEISNTFISSSNPNYYEIENFNQTNEDISFINLFYNELEQTISLNDYENNFIIAQNFATFRNMYVPSESLFQQFINLITSNWILFLEWNNIKNNYVLKNKTLITKNGFLPRKCCVKFLSSHWYNDNDDETTMSLFRI